MKWARKHKAVLAGLYFLLFGYVLAAENLFLHDTRAAALFFSGFYAFLWVAVYALIRSK